jgi:hypothetical protein
MFVSSAVGYSCFLGLYGMTNQCCCFLFLYLYLQDDLLLMQRGGNVVFYGELGDGCRSLINYFESRGAPKIELGENPANWMLKVMTSGGMGDPPKLYVESDGYASLKVELDELKQNPDPARKIEYESEFAASKGERQGLIDARLRTVYWRSPAYNLARLTVAVIIGAILGLVFVTKRNQEIFSENDMRARLSVIFLTFIIMGILAILSVLPVMTMIRDMFYRHRAAGMYDSASIAWALGVAEKWFIILTSALFTLVFLAVSGMTNGNEAQGLIGFFVSDADCGYSCVVLYLLQSTNILLVRRASLPLISQSILTLGKLVFAWSSQCRLPLFFRVSLLV